MFFFNEPHLYEVVHMADDGAPVDPPFVGNGLVPGKALVGFAVAESKQGGVGCPDRAGQSRHVLVGDFFEANPVIFFVLAGVGFAGLTVVAGCLHGIFPFHPPLPYATVKGLTFSRCHNWRGVQGPEAVVYQTNKLQGTIFSALISHLHHTALSRRILRIHGSRSQGNNQRFCALITFFSTADDSFFEDIVRARYLSFVLSCFGRR